MREQRPVSERKRILYHGATAAVIAGLILYGTLVLKGGHYYAISICVILTGILGGMLTFESGRPSTGMLTCVAIFTVMAVLSRMILAAVPQVKPIAAVVILGGIALGREAGFMIGMLSMFLSNFTFMQGSWTPFQMFAMGLVGYFGGVFFHEKKATVVRMLWVTVYGFASVLILYGGIVDINTVFFAMGENPTETGVWSVYLAGIPFDLIFAQTTALILLLLYRPVMDIWNRIRTKYEL